MESATLTEDETTNDSPSALSSYSVAFKDPGAPDTVAQRSTVPIPVDWSGRERVGYRVLL